MAKIDLSNMSDPRTMALMGLASGLLQNSGYSTRPITFGEALGSGMQNGMQGYASGVQLQGRQQEMAMQQAQNEMLQQELQRKLATQTLLSEFAEKYKNDPRGMGRALMGSGDIELMGMGSKFMPKVKSTVKGFGADGKPTYQNVFEDGTTESTGIAPAEKAMQVNQGSQISFLDPYSLQNRGAMGVGMAPGESARLAQSAQQHAQNQGLEMLKLREQIRNREAQQQMPKFQDGYFVTPPNADNPQGKIVATELAAAPKGSQAEKEKLSGKVVETLGTDTEALIHKATGSGVGALADMGMGALGVSTPSADAAHVLRMRAATLAGNMPRFEGPQSDADRKYYQQMVGEIGDPTVPAQRKLVALKELRRLHKLAPTAGGSPAQSNDGWGELR